MSRFAQLNVLCVPQVYDKWADDTDSLAAVGSLPLQQVGGGHQLPVTQHREQPPPFCTFAMPCSMYALAEPVALSLEAWAWIWFIACRKHDMPGRYGKTAVADMPGLIFS